MIKKIFDILLRVEKPMLGRWSLKNCGEMSASINSVYQNRDHCGDTICKTPKLSLIHISEPTRPY